MLEKYLQIETLSVVFLGDFNPIIFQPFWLSSKGLIREDDAKGAKVEIIHNEIVRYQMDVVSVEVTRNKCEFKTAKEPYFDSLRDLAIGTFKVLLETPIRSFGINHVYDLSLQSQEKYYSFGSRLTPLNYWNDELKDPRLLSLEIYEKDRADGQNGSRRIRITPSDQNVSFGVIININNHYNLSPNGKMLEFLQLLERNWNNSFSQSKLIVEKLLNRIDF
jgi:hypothetical protein